MLDFLITVGKKVLEHGKSDDAEARTKALLEKERKHRAKEKRHAFAFKRIIKTHGKAMAATRPKNKLQQQQEDFYVGVAKVSEKYNIFNEKNLRYTMDNVITDNQKYQESKGIDGYARNLATSNIINKFDLGDQSVDEDKEDTTIKPTSIG
tara:strand:- start:8457 stop:8909 length:453 start_codon:yes stop_codon:yes gene_type:complete